MNLADQERQPEPAGDEQQPDYRFTLANERPSSPGSAPRSR
jgi:uncharacterized membrane protein YidH (DUF202 family)